MNTYYMNESKRNPYFLCVHRNTLNHKSSSSQKTRPSRSKKRKESLSFVLSFFLSFFLCASASGGAVGMSKSCKGMLEEMLECAEQSKCYSPENGRDLKFCVTALLSSSESDATTKHGLDECMTKKQLYLKCKRGQMDMRTRIRGNKGY